MLSTRTAAFHVRPPSIQSVLPAPAWAQVVWYPNNKSAGKQNIFFMIA
jgi:hypothetical protein